MVAGKVRAAMGLSPKPGSRVKPKPPEITELVKMVEELRERENRLKMQLLEQKLLRESVAILPVLEREIAAKEEVVARSAERIEGLERELEREKAKTKEFEERIEGLSRLVEEFKTRELKRNREEAEKEEISSSSQRFPSLTIKSLSLKRFKEPTCTENHESKKATFNQIIPIEIEDNAFSEADTETCSSSSSSSEISTLFPSRTPRIAKPPPKPSTSVLSDTSAMSATSALPTAAPPPPPPPPQRPVQTAAPTDGRPPPPPPPPPAKGKKGSPAKVRRAPEVVEFYHSLMRRESRRESGGGGDGPVVANPRDMIGEIENRSSHLLAIKTDVETQGDFIRSLITEVENASFTDIKDVVPFVKWLDDELSYLVDERAVLKHFDWPEKKADALREAAFGYGDLKKLESEATTFRDDPRQPCSAALKKMQALFEKLERGVYNLSRMRESASKRYNAFHIPTDWLLESGFASQIKLASVKLAMKYMKRVSAELGIVGGGTEEEELMVQGVRFAFRVHQFAGGFDMETMKAFQELRDKATSCYVHCQTQQQKYVCRTAAC